MTRFAMAAAVLAMLTGCGNKGSLVLPPAVPVEPPADPSAEQPGAASEATPADAAVAETLPADQIPADQTPVEETPVEADDPDAAAEPGSGTPVEPPVETSDGDGNAR